MLALLSNIILKLSKYFSNSEESNNIWCRVQQSIKRSTIPRNATSHPLKADDTFRLHKGIQRLSTDKVVSA